MSGSKINSLFRDRSIFITRETGFLGIGLVEKLLSSCEPKTIYILVRPTKNVGDCEAPNLGLTKESKEILTEETTIVIHAAATVKFNESLRRAANINVRATRDVLELAKLMPRLKAFVHVSTVYSNCPHSDIEEKFYDPPMTAKLLLDILDGMDDEVLKNITPKLIGKFPNTYVFTKCIAEDLIKLGGKSLPIAVVRPAIITSSIKEPLSGWIDNFYGPLGMLVGGSLEVLRSLNMKQDCPIFVVPCDYVANTILAAASTIDKKKSTTIIYNYAGSNENILTHKEFIQLFEHFAWVNPSDKIIWYPCVHVWENPLWNKICTFFLHTLVAYIIDFVLMRTGRKSIAVKSYQKLDEMLSLVNYFNTRTWNFHYKNVENLWDKMEDDDKKLFCFNMNDVDWASYMKSIVSGGKVHLLKEAPTSQPRAVRKLRILKIAHYVLITVFWCLLLMFVRWILKLVL